MCEIKLLQEFFAIGLVATGAAFVAGLAIIFVIVAPLLIFLEGVMYICF